MAKGAVRSGAVMGLPVPSRQLLNLQQHSKDRPIKRLVFELAADTLAVAFLSRCPWFKVQTPDFRSHKPLPVMPLVGYIKFEPVSEGRPPVQELE